jgi:hypothetical protein
MAQMFSPCLQRAVFRVLDCTAQTLLDRRVSSIAESTPIKPRISNANICPSEITSQ